MHQWYWTIIASFMAHCNFSWLHHSLPWASIVSTISLYFIISHFNWNDTILFSYPFLVPLELPIVAREYFNRWYSKKAYYCALIFTDLPFQFTCVLVYMIILYLMTGQPLELFRFGLFFFISLMTSLISQSLGMIIGAAFGSKVNIIICIFIDGDFH